uniref:Uncharacterized protein n=1 Tax=Escherichia coli TaxID=562 RepID=A0A7U1E0F9_ECOLX|nr:hypothetical protein [Escherichia coli]
MIEFQPLYILGHIHDIQNNFFSNTFSFILCRSTTTKVGVCQPKGWYGKNSAYFQQSIK